MLYDITPTVTPSLAVWPGDTPPTREVLCDLSRGDSVTLSTLRATVHLGAHADAPSHYALTGPDIASRALDYYLGPCHLIDAPVARLARVAVTDLSVPLEHLTFPRVLIRTNTYPDPCSWNDDFAALDPALVHALADRGVRTIGIDTPSVDLRSSKDLPAHAAFAKRDMAILEGLVLRAVPAADYELIALPLALGGFDASPVRAVLRTLPLTPSRSP